MKKLAFICVFLVLHVLHAQNESNVWFFGQQAGIDFNSGSPAAILNNGMSTIEGCATVSSAAGDVLFYTNGVVVLNKFDTLMPNGFGLLGGSSSTQSAIIIKEPGSNDLYYIFTVTEIAGFAGLRYSKVDMSLNGGLGAVTNKNLAVVAPTCEKVTAIKHANNVDFWIVTHLFNSNAFNSYLLTANGLISTPVVSYSGISVTGNTNNTVGYLKGSHNGSKIAIANRAMDNAELFDFNNATGVISNSITFGNFTSPGAYGIEFSPNGNLLYIAESSVGTSNIYQYNLLAGSISAIKNSKIIIGSHVGVGGAIQLAPDNKIYQAQMNSSYLGVINNPDLGGLACNYQEDGFHLGGMLSKAGLPNNYNYALPPTLSFAPSNFCLGDSTLFIPSSTNPIDSVFWDFDDPASGSNNTSTDAIPFHVFSNAGIYNVHLIAFSGSVSDTISNAININAIPTIDFGNDTTVCHGDYFTLDASYPYASYLWQDNSANSSLYVNQPGTYWTTITAHQCIASDTINVNYAPPLTIDLGNDTTLCLGDTVILDASFTNATYSWQDSSVNPTYQVTEDETYTVLLTSGSCSNTTSIDIDYLAPPIVNLGNDTTLCDGETLMLNASDTNSTYLWQDNSIGATYNVSQQGSHWVTVVSNNCSTTDTIIVNYNASTELDLGKDTSLCTGETLMLDASINNATYLWQDGSTHATFSISQAGSYSVLVTTNNCTALDTININYHPLETMYLGNDTTLCQGETFLLDASITNASYLWQNSTNNSTFNVTELGTYWVNVSYNCGVISDTIEFIYITEPFIELGNDTSLCFGDTLVLDASLNNVSYLWQDNSNHPIFYVTEEGLYSVELYNNCGYQSFSLNVEILNCGCLINLPTGFSPNNDQVNDNLFPIVDRCDFEKYNFKIYNRWGEKLFETNKLDEPWNGTYKNKAVPMGVYTYSIEYKLNGNDPNTKFGNFTLIR